MPVDPEPSPEKKREEVAESAFSSPTALAAKLSARRSPPNVSGALSSASSAAHSRGGRVSMLRSESEEELFQQMASATGVVFKKAKTPEPTSPVPGLSDQQVKSAIAMADNAISTAKGLVADGTEEVKTHLSHIGTLAHAGTEEAKKRLNTIGALAYSSKMGPVPERGPGTVAGTVASSENISTASKATSISSSSRRNLDLKHNDNAFHVVANLVIDRFQSQIPPGATSYTLSEEDVAHLDQMVPASVRTSFVEAIRYRLVHNCPEDSTSQVHVLTRQAKMYGLDKEDDTNPLIASLSPTNQVITITVSLSASVRLGVVTPALCSQDIPPTSSIIDGAPSESRSVAGSPSFGKPEYPAGSASVSGAAPGVTRHVVRPALPPMHPSSVAHMEQENREFRARVEEQEKQLRQQKAKMLAGKPPMPGSVPTSVPVLASRGVDESSVSGSSFSHPSGGSRAGSATAVEAHVSTTESLARQQLMAELREASNLMAESVTPEAAQFWRNHVVDLQGRLRALHGGSSGQGYPSPSATAAELMESNRRLMEKYEEAPPPAYTPPPGPDDVQQTRALPLESTPAQQPAPEMPRYPKLDPLQEAGLPMVDVVAPADLPGGYHFEAEIEGKRFLATVPQGGVRRGETFSCLMRSLETVGADVPVGRWRDRICDYGVYGFCHPLLLNTLFCPLLSLGQVMTRLNLDIFGRPLEVRRWTTAWGTMISVVVFWFGMNLLVYGAYNYKWSQNTPLSVADMLAIFLVNGAYLLFAIYATASTRASLRDKYMIREHRCFDLEDCCCATFCMPCTICQMSRHTASYEHVGAACFTPNGLVGNASSGKGGGNSSDIYMA